MKYLACSAVLPMLLLLSVSVVAAPNKQAVLEWNRKTLTQDYLRVGKRNPKWDSHATNALNAFAKMRVPGDEVDTDTWKQFSESIRAAVKVGCDDPLIRYLYVRIGDDDQQAIRSATPENQRLIADALLGSGYSHVRRFYACVRAAAALKGASPEGKNPPDVTRLRYAAATNLADMVRDRTTPIDEAFDAFSELMQLTDANPKQFAEYCLHAEKLIAQRWPNEPLAWYARGDLYVRYAWDGRSGQYADKVSQDQWKTFEERLPVAEKALEKAWELDPNDGRIPARMITVMMGMNKPRREMEKWFDRAMKADTNNYTACDRKRYYLEPKWHGSPEEMLAFGRQCVASTNWAGRVPLILVDTHDALARYLPKETRTNYWTSSPTIWRDIKNSFEKFFQLNPDAIGWRHNYARYAYWCEQWTDLKRQIALLGPLNYSYFGGKAEYDKMVRLANERAAKE
jgi:hypothetical protein